MPDLAKADATACANCVHFQFDYQRMAEQKGLRGACMHPENTERGWGSEQAPWQVCGEHFPLAHARGIATLRVAPAVEGEASA